MKIEFSGKKSACLCLRAAAFSALLLSAGFSLAYSKAVPLDQVQSASASVGLENAEAERNPRAARFTQATQPAEAIQKTPSVSDTLSLSLEDAVALALK